MSLTGPPLSLLYPTGIYRPRSGRRLGPAASARSSMRSSSGADCWLAWRGAGQADPRAVLVTACCTDTASMVHQRLAHAEEAALRTPGGARWARTRTRSRTSWCAPAFHRPPTSLPSTTSCWGPLLSSGYAALFRGSATRKAAPSCAAAGLRETCACQRRHECGVAAQGFSERRRSVNYEVQAAPVIRADVGCCCVRQPLLDHLPIRAHGLPSHTLTHPRTLCDLRPASYQTSACASEGVVAKSVHFSSTAGGATTACTQGQREAQAAAQGQKHCLGR